MSEASNLDGLTAIDRLRLYATDPETFSFDIDDAIAAVEKYEEVECRADIAEQMAEALKRCAAALQVLPNSERDIIKFTGKWERYGSMRVSDILDRAETALSAWEASNG